ncbi:MAG: glycosyl transferase [Lachnospiraceae bacterium]|nr:glycosyl transferase [Lachnospiraceae bacterium]
MIGTELMQGQGLGNRLFCYITARCVAADRNAVFGTAGQQYLKLDYMDLDLGARIDDPSLFARYDEKEQRLYLKTSPHDMVHGCYVAGPDEGVKKIPDGTLLYGNLQAEEYFAGHRDEIRQWLKVKEEYDSYEYTADDLCILNMRGGEYADDPALFLRKRYWTDAMQLMRKEHPGMRFMIVTDDTAAAGKMFPDLPAHHFTPEKDYVTVKNARYLIMSNSSFAFFPAYTSNTLKRIIAPKYWARHNVSDGYWASAQNIYNDFLYLGRDGKLYTPEECRKELEDYRVPETSPWAENSPEVDAVRKRNERRRLFTLGAMKIRRMLHV